MPSFIDNCPHYLGLSLVAYTKCIHIQWLYSNIFIGLFRKITDSKSANCFQRKSGCPFCSNGKQNKYTQSLLHDTHSFLMCQFLASAKLRTGDTWRKHNHSAIEGYTSQFLVSVHPFSTPHWTALLVANRWPLAPFKHLTYNFWWSLIKFQLTLINNICFVCYSILIWCAIWIGSDKNWTFLMCAV